MIIISNSFSQLSPSSDSDWFTSGGLFINKYVKGYTPLCNIGNLDSSEEKYKKYYIHPSGINKSFIKILDRTFRYMPYYGNIATTVQNKNGNTYIYLMGGLGVWDEVTNSIEMLYCYMVQEALQSVQLSNCVKVSKFSNKYYGYIVPSISQLWVRENIGAHSKHLAKLIENNIVYQANAYNIKVIYKPDFKELFHHPINELKTIREMEDFKSGLLNYTKSKI